MQEKIRIKREKKTVEKMIRLYCRKQHSATSLCPDCTQLLAYAHKRLDSCKFGEQKPTCGKCPIHCYHPENRGKIQAVMSYAGPRMLLHHPAAAIRHMLDDRRSKTTT